jgi:hypothetical protein
MASNQKGDRGYLSLKRAAAWADVSHKTIRRWIKAGLPVYRGITGGKLLVRPADIEQFLEKQVVPRIDVDNLVNDTLREMGISPSLAPRGGAM